MTIYHGPPGVLIPVLVCTSPPVVLSQGRAAEMVKVTVSNQQLEAVAHKNPSFEQSSLYVRADGGLDKDPVPTPIGSFNALGPLHASDALQEVAFSDVHLRV